MRKVLVIENDVLVRDSVALSLESAGYIVMDAATWQEGVQGHQKFDPSLIISDVVSLENEGEKWRRQMSLQSASIPLITLTGTLSHSQSQSSKTGRLRPESDHTLQKPFTVDELLATVENALLERVS